MYNLGFFLLSCFYSFLLVFGQMFETNNYFILLMLVFILILLIPVKYQFKILITLYLSITMSLVLKTSRDVLSFYLGNGNIIILTLLITGYFIGKIDYKGIIGIMSLFLFIVLIIYVFSIITKSKTFLKGDFMINYNYILIPLDMLMLNIIKPKEVNKFIIPLGFVSLIVLFFLVGVATNIYFSSYVNYFPNKGFLLLKIQNVFDELGGFEFLYFYIIPVLALTRIAINFQMIKKLGFYPIIGAILCVIFLFVEVNILYLIFLSTIITIGGIYGYFRKVQE